MLRKDNTITRYIGGGKVFFEPEGGPKYEIGEIQSVSFSATVETEDAFSRDTSMEKLVDRVVRKTSASGEFTTQNINEDNMAMAFMGAVVDEVFASGDTLPDGSVAAAEVTLKKIVGGVKPIIEGKLTFVGDEDGDEKPVLVIYRASLTPTGQMGYISNTWATLGFNFEALQTDDGFYDEYRMVVA